MGAWGARIYEDDAALDVRGEFIEQFKAGKPVDEIEKHIKDEYFEDDDSDDVAKLALCCVELEMGVLTPETKNDALEVIESGRDLKRWREEADAQEAGLRSHELTLIKKYVQNYDGQPVKRKSWTELQRDDRVWQSNDAPDQSEFDLEKLDDVGWHVQDAKASDEETQIAQAGAHIACFVYWLVTRDFFQPFDKDSIETVGMVKRGELTPIQFLEDEMDEKLFAGNAKPEVHTFVEDYYGDSNNRFYYDFMEVVSSDRDLYSFIPTEAEYESMAERIDERLKKFRQKNNKK